MQERIDLVVVAEERRKAGGLSASVAVSLLLHALLLVWFIRSYNSIAIVPQDAPIPRYVELMRQNPERQPFTEAPGPAIDRAPSPNAALSDRNRRASSPRPTGDQPTTRPGDGSSSIYTPPSAPSGPRGVQQSAIAPSAGVQGQQQQQQPMTDPSATEPRTAPGDSSLIYRKPVQANSAAPLINMAGIRAAARAASRSGDGGLAFPSPGGGGDSGFTAETGPLSFETDWYEWGDYDQGLVSKIRVNWHANMPEQLWMGEKGVVTIRFTIHRDGRVSDVTILNKSGVPPYDYAARKAIELSSPFKPLPVGFPYEYERVTCRFYYNMEIPRT